MAEFKLGRIRFVWKGDWTAAQIYYQDDVISFGGKMYICVIGHTASASFFSDFDIIPPKWNLVSDGQTWKGNWEPQVEYVYDDIVKYGARLYICKTPHTSAIDSTTGLEADQANWEVFAEGLEWLGEWQTNYDYKVNDLVKYGGQSYVCNEAHISSATDTLGLEDDQDKWDSFNRGIEFKNSWSTGVRYKVNDIVQYGASLYIAQTAHTSTDFTSDRSNWDTFVQGFQFEDEWSPFRVYQQGDVVRYGGNQFLATQENSGSKPQNTGNVNWELFSRGLKFVGEWQEDSTNQEYLPGESVSYGGYTYVCQVEHSNQNPTNTSYWTQLNSGLRWRGAWLDDEEYVLGDVVRYNSNTFVCVQGHISEGDDFSTETATEPGGGAENSRPDLDANGTYWNLLSIGSETSVLTTPGDLVYYSQVGPTRLPIGAEGQVLRVSDDSIPEWAYLGQADDVYYVAEHGANNPAPTNGLTIDRPYASIRYAAEQVENGTKNPQARKLLELNRQFIQRETLEWIEQQVADATSPFTGAFQFDTNKCQRDMGLIVDAVIWDITHGGNVKTREAALSYVNDTVGSPYLTQKDETAAAINYALEVMGYVLAQTDPDVNYQVTRGDNSTAIVAQYKDETLTAETGVLATVTSLVGIITDAIAAGVADNIPERDIRTVLIRVATGKYYETLPIIVPAETCIMGDELRAVTVSPRKESNSSLTSKTDTPFSYQALDRVENIIGDIVKGVSVTPTTGNAETQSADYPFGEQLEADAATQLARTIKRRIDHGVGEKIEAIYTPAYEMSNANLGKARDLIIKNKEFIKAEIIAYIANNTSVTKYSRTKCKQDVGYIIDAISYDMTYGGNWQSVNAGLAYFNGNTGTLQIDSSEKSATLAAYGYLKQLVPVVGRNLLEASPEQSVVEQVRGVGSAVSISGTTDPLFDEIIDIITNGPDSANITYPDISGVEESLTKASGTLVDAKVTIQDSTIDFISKNFGSFKYNATKCRRDLTNLLTDLSFDGVFNTNYNQIYNGIAYQRGNNDYLLGNQVTQTVGAIEFARDQAVISVTTDGSSETGSTTYGTRIEGAFDEVVDIIENGLGAADALSLPSPTGADANRVTAKDQLQINKTYIRAEIVAYINKQISDNAANPGSIWYNFVYDSTKCSRDVGYIVDALSYDMLYEGTMATTRMAEAYYSNAVIAGQEDQTAAAYDYLATVVADVIRATGIGPTTGNGEIQDTGTYGDAGAALATEIDGKVQIIEDVITAGSLDSLPAPVYPNISNETSELQAAKSSLDSDRTDIIRSTIQYINTTYNDFNFDHAKCSRDLGLIIDAARYDWMLGTNFAGIVAAYSYLRQPSVKVVGEQKEATLAANEYARTLAVQYVNSNATAIAGINSTWQTVEDIIWSGSAEGGLLSVDNFNAYSAIRQIELNKDFIVAEVHAYVSDYFSDTVTGTNGTTNTLTISDTSWLEINTPITFESPDSTDAITEATLNADVTYYVREIVSSTEFTITATPGDSEVTISTSQAGFTVRSTYTYSQATCTRDVLAYLDAIKWDMQYPQEWKRTYTDDITVHFPASYKTRLAARYYVNSVTGSQEEDMFYLRNGTGLRLMTLDGLQGDLGPANAYGTSRPTAGAYASLDPGWGVNDERVWITARSPYVQNLTTFGYAATGQRIDGALHNGGNDSIVSNDFTQVISDGIGAHILNNGRAELVSVFTYYSHIGYLAETGGRIRATNGNNSYGTFGSVAEGVDPDEIPVSAVVDNRQQFNADISSVFTDNDKLLVLQYTHAGNEYTDAAINFFGPGEDEEVVYDDFRDNAVFQARLINDPGGNDELGGDGYTVNQNTAQAGSNTSLNLAATDGNPSTAYPGMTLILTGGAGAGQYGIIDTYNSGSKLATVIKASDGTAGWDHFVPGTTIVTPNSSTTYIVEPTVTFSEPPRSSEEVALSSSQTWTDVAYFTSADIYTGVSGTSSADGTGATFDVTRSGSKYSIELDVLGSGYARLETITILGSTLDGIDSTNDLVVTVTTVNADGGIVDFDFVGVGLSGKFVATSTGQAGSVSVDGETWTAETLPAPGSGSWSRIATGKLDDGSSAFQPGYIVVSADGDDIVAYSTDANNWSTANTGLTITGNTDIAFGQISVGVTRFVQVSDATRDIAYSDTAGASWSVVSGALDTPFTGTGDIAITYGKGVFVAVRKGSDEAAYSTDGISWTAATGLSSETWEDVAYGNNRFVAIASTTNTGAYSLDGITWVEVTLPDLDGSSVNAYKRVAYGQGVFVATSDNSGAVDDYNTVSWSEDGVYWRTQGVVPAVTAGMGPVAFGNPQAEGQFIAIDEANGTTVAVKLKIGAKAKARPGIASEQIFEIRLFDPGSGYYNGAPTLTVTDPGNIEDAYFDVRVGNGALAQPSFINRGTGFQDASAEIDGPNSNGFADFYQTGDFIAVRRLTSRPVNGSNIVFSGQPNTVYKLVNTISFLGTNDGSYTAFLQISPQMEVEDAPEDGEGTELRIRYSQVRLTGHDFLDIGTGNFVDTNYPGTPVNDPDPDNETVDSDGGRVFFTATDQDGNFRVGPVFSVEQATGIATLNAEAFNIAGLQELSLGEVTLGGNSASITEFSTDPFFTANSDSVVPTQRAIKAYIEGQIGGGGASLNVNSVTAGDIFIDTNRITSVSGGVININAQLNFTESVVGLPIAYNYFLR